MKETLQEIITALVDEKNKVEITEESTEIGTTYFIKVGETDIGRIIGKSGKTISSLRTIFKAAGLKQKKNIRLEIVDDGERPQPIKE